MRPFFYQRQSDRLETRKKKPRINTNKHKLLEGSPVHDSGFANEMKKNIFTTLNREQGTRERDIYVHLRPFAVIFYLK